MIELIQKAADYAEWAHKHQVRKYTGEPYFTHCQGVVDNLLISNNKVSGEMIAAAYLHDVVEDTQVTINDIEEEFGNNVATLVYGLTKQTRLSDGNRAVRKEFERQRLSDVSKEVQLIKHADLIHNLPSIVQYDPEFAVTWLKEMRELLDSMTKVESNLRTLAYRLLDVAEKSLEEENMKSDNP